MVVGRQALRYAMQAESGGRKGPGHGGDGIDDGGRTYGG